ncbi:hypothetical protein Zmor_028172 [Zophobas morio]|uniref:Uncharacterized protein n=1 Tax=Zophobas morio TaxID=2755281 RepID=A0AA38HQB5_9CUCU|nr:hypothetical protein Zmor_028172 [Zophobas morio]
MDAENPCELEVLVNSNDGNTPQTKTRIDFPKRDSVTFREQVIQNKIQVSLLKRSDVNSLDGNVLKKPILLLACEEKAEFKRVNHETVKLLLEKGAKADYVDTTWYGWEALHYAAYASNPDKLQALCDKLGEHRVNTLTMLSENALHVLLEHGILGQSFHVSWQNGTDTRMEKIINKEEENVTKSAQVLINAKIDINHTNFWNQTPILIAIKRRYFRVVRLLLEKSDIDLDSCKDAVSGKTARELLEREKWHWLPKGLSSRSPKEILFSFLKSGDEDNFLEYNDGKISDIVDDLDGDNAHNSSCTLLQYCFRRGLIFCYKDKANNDCDQNSQDITSNRLMNVFCKSGMGRSIQHLINNGANPYTTLRKFEQGHSILEAAIIKGYYPMVALILSKPEAEPPPYNKICASLFELLKNHSRSIDLNNTFAVVLSWLLDQFNTLRANEKKLNTNDPDAVLDKSFQNLYEKIEAQLFDLFKFGAKIISTENQLLLLKFPNSLCWTNEDVNTESKTTWWCCQSTHWNICSSKSDKKLVIEEIDPEVLHNHLDDCVEQEGTDVKINCDSFLKDGSIYPVFDIFLSSKKFKGSLNHLVFKILIMRHWETLNFKILRYPIKYIHLNLVFYGIIYFLLHLDVLYRFNGVSYSYLSLFLWTFLWPFIVKELLQMIANFKLYWQGTSNYFEVIFIVSVFFMYTFDKNSIDAFRVLSVLSSNVVLFFLLENIPACSKYVSIFRKIGLYLKTLFFFFIQLLGFAISFYILFSKKNQVWTTEIPNKIFEMLILLTGNLDYKETSWNQENKNGNNGTNQTLYHDFPHKEHFSKFIFILFVLFLFLGLRVIDKDDLQKDSLSEQVNKAGFVLRMHIFFRSRCMNIFLAWVFRYSDLILESKITVDDNDRKILTKEEKQNLDFMLTKKTKRPNILKKLRNYVKMKTNAE